MAHFYATMQGSAGVASRIGSANSGISAHPRGWHCGVLVNGRVEDGEDVFYIYATGGSTGAQPSEPIGVVRLVDGRPTFEAIAAYAAA
jgi:hypothetical protein